MDDKIEPGVSSWRLWLLWVFANGISFSIGTGVTMGALKIVFKLENYPTILYLAVVILAIVALGFVPGAAQGLVLRRYLGRTAEWILATTGGFTLALLPIYLSYRLFFLVNTPFESVFIMWLVMLIWMVLNGISYGFSTGTLQWFVLKSKVPQATRWILFNTFSWGFGVGVGSIIAIILTTLLFILIIGMEFVLHGMSDGTKPLLTVAVVLVGVIIGIFSSMISGATMVRLLQGSNSKELKVTSASSTDTP
jgi:hypothetical protein